MENQKTFLFIALLAISAILYQKWLVPDAGEQEALRVARVGVLVVGLIGFAIAYFQLLGIFWLVVLSASLLASVYFVPMMAGFFSINASGNAAIAAMVAILWTAWSWAEREIAQA